MDNQKFIKKTAKERFREKTLGEIFLIQLFAEFRFRLKKRSNFRKRENDKASEAYSQMEIDEFEAINSRQHWANWRIIPKNVTRYFTQTPIRAIDLCCGTGQSTEVLSYYLPNGSTILGMDNNPAFIKQANKRDYFHQDGKRCEVKFRVQSVLEEFKNERGEKVQAETIDLVNSSGAIAFHFDEPALKQVIQEAFRVLKPGGIAAIDSSLRGLRKSQLIPIFESYGFEPVSSAKTCLIDPNEQVCFQKKSLSYPSALSC